MSNDQCKIFHDGKKVMSPPIINRDTIENKKMSTIQKDKVWLEIEQEDREAYETWLDEREMELIAQEAYVDWMVYGRYELEARRAYSQAHPWEPYDTPFECPELEEIL
jgi:hypothetical protein